MKDIQICPVGEVRHEKNKMYIQIYPQYAKALTGLDEYKHVMVVWWFDKCDNDKERNILEMVKPYKVGPEKMGMFALRQPQRPNPVAVSVAEILTIDYNSSIVEVNYIDALDNSPVIDLKPYIPSLDWVENPVIPEWSKHWPDTYEKSLDYNWKNEFTSC